MSALAAIALIAATSTTAPPTPVHLTVLISETIGGEQDPREPELDPQILAAFSGTFTDTAVEIFAWRHFLIVSGEEAENAVKKIAKGGVCRSVLCTRDVAFGIGATHALFSRLTRLKDGSCTVLVSLYDLLKNKEDVREKREIKPCVADNVLSAAVELGKRAADGPRAPVIVTLDLTKRQLRPIDIADIDNIDAFAVTTSTVVRKRRGFTLERALEIYKEKHMFTFDDENHPGSVFIARNNHLINECEVRRAASAPLPREIREFCEGNNWEYAWLGFPVGVLISFYAAGSLDQGGGILGFLLGLAMSGTSAALALVLNIDAVDVEEGTHYSDHDTIETIVHKSNETLREVLDLTPAEVEVAGMRK